MRRRFLVVLASMAAMWCAPLAVTGAAHAGTAAGVGVWGRAIEVPGLGALNAGGAAVVSSVSCPSAGNCAAGGGYFDRSGNGHAFVVSERRGVWGRAIEVSGLSPPNIGGAAAVYSVSCGSAGNCAAGGFYVDDFGFQAFVVSERHGIWGRAIEVPGSGALNAGGLAYVTSVSCASASDCAAGGIYTDGSRNTQSFVVSERHGIWGTAIGVPGLGALNGGGNAGLLSMSCASAGNCAAGGFYFAGSGSFQAFVVSEREGAWGSAIDVPGLGSLNAGGDARVSTVSCASAGNCAVGGDYTESSGSQAFVASEREGIWGRAIEVPGSGALNAGGFAHVTSVSCVSAGNCAAGGFYSENSGSSQAFVVIEREGIWGRAIEVPGSGALNPGGFADITSVSCASPDNCAAGGYYTDSSSNNQAFVVSEQHGIWGRAIEVPGSGVLNKGARAHISSVSCAPSGSCAAGGYYTDRSSHQQGFVVSRT